MLVTKAHPFAAVLAILLLSAGTGLEAGGSYKLETRVYVFRNSDFRPVTMPGAVTLGETQGAFFNSPATAQFGQETLSLSGAQFVWSGGRNPPDRVTLVSTPTVPLLPGKPVTLLSTMSVQYLEERDDGTLQIREILRDSPEAPHFRFTFALEPSDDTSSDLRLACILDIAMVSTREKVPGVTLNIGKPVLRRFNQKLDLTVGAEEWSALALQALNGSDYSLLVLLKPAGVDQVAAPMMPEELDKFVVGYYRQPQPGRIVQVIESLGPSGFARDRADVFVGFFAEVFATNPDRMTEWQKFIAQQDKPIQDLLQEARKLSHPNAILALEKPSVALNDRYWGAFFASGNPAYLRKLTDRLKLVDDYSDLKTWWVGATAMWSLARNAPEHPLIRTTLEAARAGADRPTRGLIGEILEKEPQAIRKELLAVHRQRFGPYRDTRMHINGAPGGGLRDMGDFGPVNPQQEMGTRH